MKYGRLLGLIAACAVLTGCHYRVTDPASGNVYYTTSIKNLKHGAIEFVNAADKAKITLQSSEVMEVSDKEFKAGIEAAAPE